MELILYVNDSPLIKETLPDNTCMDPNLSTEANIKQKEVIVTMNIQHLKNKHEKLLLKVKRHHFELSVQSCMNQFDDKKIEAIMQMDDKDLIDLNF